MTDTAPLQQKPLLSAALQNAVAVEGPQQGTLDTLSTSLNAAPSVQRVAAMVPNRTGLPDRLKSGIESMARMSLDHVRVHRNSSKPAQLNAHAYAQGSDIHLAPGQENHLPHEAWHVVQQAQGRVKATTQMKTGVPVNDDAGLELEADVMGEKAQRVAVQRRQSLATIANPFAAHVMPVQRSVVDFDAALLHYDPPASDLVATIDPNYFKGTTKQINQRIRERLNDPLLKTLAVPSKVTATVEQSAKGAKHPARGSRSANIGLIGRDEFWVKSGVGENFEGGHVIPHSLWDDDDNDVAMAGAYDNLVPMSRTLNVETWGSKEEEIRQKLASIPSGDQLELSVSINHKSYDMDYNTLSNRFNLPLETGADGTQSITLYGWIPTSSQLSWKHIETGSDEDLSDVEENNLRNTHKKIKTAADLIESLQESGMWMRMSDKLKSDLEGL